MQITDVRNEGLQRAYQITVPEAEMEKAVAARLAEIAKTVKIDGFRPGKVPMTLVTQRYGDAARYEVVEKKVEECVEKTIADRKLRPALQPRVEFANDNATKDLVFNVSVEILPDVTPMDFSTIKLTRKVAEVPETELADTVARIVKRMRQPVAITEKRAAKMGDITEIDFDGKVDGEARPGMKGENHRLELGTKSFIDTFEDQIVGMKVDATKDITVTFPADYHAAELSGKEAVFTVTLKAILEHTSTELDDELAKENGFDDAAAMKTRIKESLSEKYNEITRMVLKRELMDALAEGHTFEVPAGMVEAEFTNIWKQLQHEKAHGHLSAEDAKKSDDELKTEYRAIAERRIRLGLVLAHVAESNKIEASQDEIRKALFRQASSMPGHENQVFDYYMKNRQALDALRAEVLEEKIVEFLASKAQVTDKTIPAADLEKLPDEMD